ncbi:hypothetical protein FJZ53_01780 [Candidatus Woesearchaeota archaeon]|nr:hypothetical protein [Candidatus Woesearchaeota archaeon]
MEVVFIESKSNVSLINVLRKIKTKDKLGLITTIQHSYNLEDAKKLFPNSVIGGQVLGCDVSAALKIKDQVDLFLFIGSGEFHPLGVALKTDKEVIIADPLTGKVSKITKEDIATYRVKLRGKYVKFLKAEKVGILVSVKPGQYNLETALHLQNKLEKRSYILVANNFSETELENYPDIETFINTACPRIEFHNVINLEDVEEMIKRFS